MIFPDRKLVIFGRLPDIEYLIGRAKTKGLTAVVARPKMGKTWLLIDVARRLSEEDAFLVGYYESKGGEHDMLLRSLLDLYGRWLEGAPPKEQIQNLWERHKDKLLTRSGKAVGSVFEA